MLRSNNDVFLRARGVIKFPQTCVNAIGINSMLPHKKIFYVPKRQYILKIPIDLCFPDTVVLKQLKNGAN